MTQPSNLLILALAAYVPLVFFAFHTLGGRRGMLMSLLGGWLFLPWFNQVGRSIPLLHSKEMFVPAVVFAVSLLMDGATWRALRLRLLDLPVAVVCVSPFFTSVANNLGAYDGAASVFHSAMVWGAPYLLGRAYLGPPAALLDAARALVLAGVAYVPFCLWEIRMSPQLHRQMFGFHQHSFAQHVRDGHFRPMLFMAHGLMVSMFMASAALVAFWLWRSRSIRSLGFLRMPWAVAALIATTVLCRSVGSTVLMAIGLILLELTKWIRTPALLLVLALAPSGYCALRISDWDFIPMVERAGQLFGPNRAESLRIRLVNDQELKNHDMKKPWLGWGKWNSSRLRDEEGRDVSIVDSMWILILGTGGLTVLIATGIVLALPLLLLVRAVPVQRWCDPRLAPPASFSVVVGIWAVDDLFNAMMSPIFPALAGAVVSFSVLARTLRERGRQIPGAARTAPARAVRTLG